ncbi:MAG: CBS domain-containing protein [Betaproteobacteria bacterium]|jgi:CBS domain-containing protein
MSIGEICNRHAVCARRDATVKVAAQLMREHHVGSVVVADELAEKRVPVGILTDRDIAVAVVALGLDPEVIQIGDIMGNKLVSVREDWSTAEVVELMQIRGVRRMVVTDADDHLVGIVTADDVMSLLAEEMSALADMVSGERKREAALRKVMV